MPFLKRDFSSLSADDAAYRIEYERSTHYALYVDHVMATYGHNDETTAERIANDAFERAWRDVALLSKDNVIEDWIKSYIDEIHEQITHDQESLDHFIHYYHSPDQSDATSFENIILPLYEEIADFVKKGDLTLKEAIVVLEEINPPYPEPQPFESSPTLTERGIDTRWKTLHEMMGLSKEDKISAFKNIQKLLNRDDYENLHTHHPNF